jgi:hypothetical protein
MATQVSAGVVQRTKAHAAAADAVIGNIAPGNLFRVTCTVAGIVAAVLEDDSVELITVATGYITFPYAVKRVNSTSTTATATYANLYFYVL